MLRPMNISAIKLANGQWEIIVNGITVATCDTEAQKTLICGALWGWGNFRIKSALYAVLEEPR